MRPSAIILKYYTVRFVALEIFSFITDQMASKSSRSLSLCCRSFPTAIVIAVLNFYHHYWCFPLVTINTLIYTNPTVLEKKKKAFNTQAQYVYTISYTT